jgi:hypothetical protein
LRDKNIVTCSSFELKGTAEVYYKTLSHVCLRSLRKARNKPQGNPFFLVHDHTLNLHVTNESASDITALFVLVEKLTLKFLLSLIKHPYEELKCSPNVFLT